MKLLFVASECAPFVKTGGLGDVIGSLPQALARQGADVRVMLPKYSAIRDEFKREMRYLTHFYVHLGWRTQYVGVDMLEREGVTYYFIDNEQYFARDYVYGSGDEEGERYSYFCRAALDALSRIDFRPDVIHCHDWQTGMIAPLLRMQYFGSDFYSGIRTVYTIHNLRYQGIFPWLKIKELLDIDDQHFTSDKLEYFNCINFMKAAIVFSDRITTVSPTYADEIKTAYFGERLDGLLNARSDVLSGILNGISTASYDPATDNAIPANFSIDDMAGKAICRRELRKELGLWEDESRPLIAMVTRLVDQKGIDLVERVIDEIMRTGAQMIVLGKGDQRYHDLFGWASWRYGGNFATRIELNEPLSRRIYAGADMFLIPSQFEPCGLTQMISMRYGTIPIVRETGGLKDSVEPYNKFTDSGTGFSFANYNAHDMLYVIESAVSYFYDRQMWSRLMQRAMRADFSWDVSAVRYFDMYAELLGAPSAQPVSVPEAPAPEAAAEDAPDAPAEEPKPKKRAGRKPKAEAVEGEAPAEAPKPRKKPGPKPKAAKAEAAEPAEAADAESAPKKRTRKPKAAAVEAEAPVEATAKAEAPKPRKKPGPKPKAKPDAAEAKAEPAPEEKPE